MMRLRLLLALMFVLVGIQAAAQDVSPDDVSFRLVVDPDSAIIRSLPTRDGEFIASAYRGDVLEAVGRNMDGMWFQVRRPGRMNTLGWISRRIVDYEFAPETLPLVDFETDVTGDFALMRDPGFAAFTLAEVNLRVQPLTSEAVITTAPFGVVLPILERDRVGDWVLVTYLGTTGWVNTSNLRGVDDFAGIPVASNLPEPVVIQTSSVFVIPLETQLSEIEAFRGYLNDQYAFSQQLVGFWSQVFDYEWMPCEPPEFVTTYLYSRDSERAFPELEYLVPRLDTAIEFVNGSIEPMYVCGVKSTELIITAKNNAVNASVIYAETLRTIAGIERQITANR